MLAAEPVARLIASGLCIALEELTIYGSLQDLGVLWDLLDASTALKRLEMRSASPAPDSAPRLAARPHTLRLANCNTRWLTTLVASSLCERLQHLELVRLQGVSKGTWPSVPVEGLAWFGADNVSLPAFAAEQVIARLSPALEALELSDVSVSPPIIERVNAFESLRTLALRGRAVGDREAAALGPCLNRVERLDVSSTSITDRGLHCIADAAARVRSIDMSGLGVSGEAMCELVTRARCLEDLSACRIPGAPDDFASLGAALGQSEDRWRALSFDGTPIDDRVGCELGGQRLSSVRLNHTRVGRATAEKLLGSAGLAALSHLELGFCTLGDLGPAPGVRPRLASLLLGGTRLGLAEPEAFFDPDRLPALIALDLSHHRLAPGAVPALARMARTNRMRMLRIVDSPLWKPADFAELFEAIGPTVVALAAGRDWSSQALAVEALARTATPALTHLDLGECEMEPTLLARLLDTNPLQRLATLSAWGEQPEVVELLADHAIMHRLARVQVVGAEGLEVLEQSGLLGRYTVVSG